MKLPVFMRKYVYNWYAKKYNVNLNEVELPLHQYATFSDFFTRHITRLAHKEVPNTIASPCDGKLLSFEEVTEDKCHIIKGHRYSLTSLLMG
jgi:phosphatidylserine decarboxylase